MVGWLDDVRNGTAGDIGPIFCLHRRKGQKVTGNGSCCEGTKPAAIAIAWLAASEWRHEIGREGEGFRNLSLQGRTLGPTSNSLIFPNSWDFTPHQRVTVVSLVAWDYKTCQIPHNEMVGNFLDREGLRNIHNKRIDQSSEVQPLIKYKKGESYWNLSNSRKLPLRGISARSGSHGFKLPQD